MERSLQALRQQRRRVEELQAERCAPIAVVGMACRFPGAEGPDAFWRLLDEGRAAITEVGSDRWSMRRSDGDGAAQTGRHAGLLADPGAFDAEFFGISPREATSMDPQQRWVLEEAWHALEDAAIAPESLHGTRAGVFVGATARDYAARLQQCQADTPIDAFYVSGNALNFIAGRLAYQLGLRGPSLAVDTACSSALTAVHLAIQSLRRGECAVAIAAGVNIVMAREVSEASARSNLLAADGRCKTFDASADGIVRGEGCGVLVLMPLAAALEQGRAVRAVLRGSAINQDGASSGLMTPNLAAQVEVVNAALADAQVSADAVDYVEAHGTGTALGDPIELRALGQVFGDRTEPLWVGSVKTNIGHLESAAGMAGLIKVILSMHAGVIAPHLHLAEPTPHVDWSRLPLRVPVQSVPWPRRDRPRLAGVSAFGGSGSNAHVIVEQGPPAAVQESDTPWLLPLSAHTPGALHALSQRWIEALEGEPDEARRRLLCARARTGRGRLRHRVAVAGASAAELIAALSAGTPVEGPARAPVVAFLFSGQGAQYVGMGRDLYDAQPAFRKALDGLAGDFLELAGADIRQVLWEEDGARLAQAKYAQPALFVLQTSLVRTWASFGVHPDVVLGHSIGEIAAACAAQAFDVRTGLRLAAARGRLMQAHCSAGGMLAVTADASQVAQWIAPFPSLVVAARNASRQTVVAGETAAVEAFADHLQQRGVQAQRLQVSHAFHSALMTPMLQPFGQACRELELGSPALDLVSTRTGALERDALADPSHWVDHVREPVACIEALETLAAERPTILVEIGPGRTLLGFARLAGLDAEPVASLQRGREARGFLDAQAQLFRSGAPIQWPRVGGEHVSAPPYPFQRQVFMVDAGPEPEPERPGADLLDWHWHAGALPAAGGQQPVLLGLDGDDAPCGVPGHWPRLDTADLQAPADAALVDIRFLDAGRHAVADAVAQLARSYGAWVASPGRRTYWLCLPEHAADDAHAAMVRGALTGFALSMAWRGGPPIGVMQTAGPVDLSDPETLQLLSADATAVANDPWWRNDAGQWTVARLCRRDAAVPVTATIDGEGGARVVTGGFGDLGLALVERLAREHDGPIVVLSRRAEGALDDGSRQRLAGLRAGGARIRSFVVDVAQRDALVQVFDALHAEGLRVTDVYHVAGTLAPSTPAQERDPVEVRDQLAAKQAGAQWLHEVMSGMPDARLLLVGSAAGAWGSGDHALYAAANAAVAGLARWRVARGLPTVHVAAGPIAGTAMAAGADGDRTEAAGLQRMATAALLDAMDRLRHDPVPSAVVVQADWPRFGAACSSRTAARWFEAIAPRSMATAGRVPGLPGLDEEARSGEPTPWATLSSEARRQRLRHITDTVVANALGIHGGGFDVDAPLLDAGVDSVIALEISQALSQRLGIALPATLVFEHASARAIAEHLSGVMFPDGTPQRLRGPAPHGAAVDEPIAIIGASARMPGGADDIHGFWRNLLDGVDGIVDAPRERFDVDAWLGQPPGERPYTLAMGALSGIECFDAALFGIGPREAGLMDPQQRLVLQGAWHALEHAGIDPLSLRGRRGGVFLGVADCEYLPILRQHTQLAPDLAYLGTGTKTNVIAGRVSYVFGWEGPSVALDTACSSAATAIHLACRSLRSGESDFALAGGINLILDPQTFASPCKANMLARDGRCKSFDRRADGYVRSEGCGLVVLKRLSDALRDGDTLLATVLGSAINQDGRSSSLTAPNPAAQQQVIEHALQAAGVAPDDVDLVETHGTGTPLGDPIEWAALSAVFDGPARGRPLWLGSAKSMIGHTEAAAGAAGLIKLALCLRNGRITDNCHFDALNPEIARRGTTAIHVAHAADRQQRDVPRIGGISSFGFSGTNVHLVLAAPPPSAPPAAGTLPVLCVSAGTPAALREACERWLDVLDGGDADSDEYSALCAASRWGRWPGPCRLAIAATRASRARAALRQAMATYEDGIAPQGQAHTVVRVDALSLADADHVLAQLGQSVAAEPDARIVLGTVAFARALAHEGVVVEQWQAGEAPLSVLAAVAGSLDAADAWRVASGHPASSTPRAPAQACIDAEGRSLDHRFADPAFWAEYAHAAVRGPQDLSDTAISLRALVPGSDADAAPFAARLLAQAFALGLGVRWSDRGARRSAEAPLTRFAKTRFWPHAGTPLVQMRPARPGVDGHYLLGARHALPRSTEIRFRRRFTSTSPAYVDDHRLLNTVVVPAASHLSMVLSAWRASGGAWPCTVEDVRLLSPLVLHDDGTRTVELILSRHADGFEVELVSCDGDDATDDAGWTTHMRCRLRGGAGPAAAPVDAGTVLRDWTPTISRDAFYAQFWEHGYTLGDSFRWLGEGWVQAGCTIRTVFRPQFPEPVDPFELHPGLIDTCFSVLSSGQLAWTGDRDDERIFIPVSIEMLEFYGWRSDHGSSWMHARACAQPAADGARAREDICLFETDGHVVARITGFETRQAQREALRFGYRDSVRDQLYRVDWQPAPAPATAATGHAGRIGVVADDCALADAFASSLPRQWAPASRASWPLQTGESPVDGWAGRLVEQLRHDGVQTLLLLPPLQDGAAGGRRVLLALVALWQALQGMDVAARPAIALVTRDAAALQDDPPNPLHAALWGFARGLQAEHGERALRILDLHTHDSLELQAGGIIDLLADASLSQAAWRRGQRWEPRLQRYKMSRSHGDLAIRRDARYVISGGLGGIGQALAHWLIERGAGLVQLLVRRPDAAAAAALEARAAGHESRIEIVVAASGGIDALIGHALPLAGIFHAAGSTADALVMQADAGSVETVIDGKWRLAEALADLALHERPDVVVMFGSLAATLPGPGQALYAAANAALEAIAAGMRAQGVHAVTIGFGPWSETGMTSRLGAGYEQRLLAMGLQPFNPAQGLHVLSQLAQEPHASVIAAAVQWSTFLATRREYTASPVLEAFRDDARANAPVEEGQLRTQLQALPPSQREAALELALKAAIAKVLGLSGPAQVGGQRRLFDLGLDSMAAMDLREMLQSRLGIRLRATVLFDYPSVEALCRYLMAELWPPAATGDAPREQVPIEIDALSEADAEALLLAELKE